jgi:hypothetical protein
MTGGGAAKEKGRITLTTETQEPRPSPYEGTNPATRYALTTAAELLEQARLLRGQPHVVAQSPSYPLLNLEHRDFEAMVALLLRERIGKGAAFDRVVLLAEGPDKGRDLLLVSRGRVVGVIQCKRHKEPLGEGAFLTQLLRFALFAVRDPAVRPQSGASYQLWTAGGISAPAH